MSDETELKPGAVAPDLALPDDEGRVQRLGDLAGHQIVLFFFPRADTPGCTTEAQDFSARHAEFGTIDTVVIGVSADSSRKLARFRSKRAISVKLLSDESGEALRRYGVWGEKSMYGKTFEGILRTTFLIGRDGRLRNVWRGVKVPNHAQEVLDAARRTA